MFTSVARKYQIMGVLRRSSAVWTAAQIAIAAVPERFGRLLGRLDVVLTAGTAKIVPVSLFVR
jgi:hypothetical protein